MSSKIISTLIPNDQGFSSNFDIINYDKSENSFPILDIWKDIQIVIKQEEKVNSFIYSYHDVKVNESIEGISNLYYDTTKYWWLVLLTNDVYDPFDFLLDNLNNDTPIKILKNQHVSKILGPNNSLDLSKYFGMDTNDQ
jgi:hypothetical protein